MLKTGERIDQLHRLEIQIIQSPAVFSFSMDAVLLADFARLPKQGQIVDLCAGNGAVGLFMSHKTNGTITGVELQPRLADMAQRSIELNQLEKQLNIVTMDLKDVSTVIAKDSVDVVTCNPPYFKVTPESQKNPNQHLALARHEIATDLKTVVQTMSGLLKMNGRAYLVHRPDRFLEICDELRVARLEPKKVQFIYPKAGKEASMVLIEAVKDGRPGGLRLLPELTIYDQNSEYTPEMRKKLFMDDWRSESTILFLRFSL